MEEEANTLKLIIYLNLAYRFFKDGGVAIVVRKRVSL